MFVVAGVLGLLYLSKMGGLTGVNFLQLLSVASSFVMLGVKLSKPGASPTACDACDALLCTHLMPGKLPQLKVLLNYKSKQEMKCARTTAKAIAEDTRIWVEKFPQLKKYGPKFEGLQSKRLLQLKDVELLNEFGIESDVDRRYRRDSSMVLID